MSKLIALPVSGDSFLLQRGNRTILVDGGHGSRSLIAALSSPRVSVNYLDIVVCTHADKDHAGGLTDLLEKSSIHVGEFWLPGAWSDSLPNLLQNPRLVVNSLVAELDQFNPDGEPGFDETDDGFELRAHARIAEKRGRIRRERLSNDGKFESRLYPGIAEKQKTERELPNNKAYANAEGQNNKPGLEWLKTQAANLKLDKVNDAASAKEFDRGRRLIRYRASKRWFTQNWITFWLDLIDTAERIRKIAVQAIRHDVKVRWFDFGKFATSGQPAGGEPGLLVPLNAVELVVPPLQIAEMEYMLRLTPVNEECLVFWSPPDRSQYRLGVVFTGDSPLGDGPGYRRNFLRSSSVENRLKLTHCFHLKMTHPVCA